MYSNIIAITHLRRNYVTYVEHYVTYVELRVLITYFPLRNLRKLRNFQRNFSIKILNGTRHVALHAEGLVTRHSSLKVSTFPRSRNTTWLPQNLLLE